MNEERAYALTKSGHPCEAIDCEKDARDWWRVGGGYTFRCDDHGPDENGEIGAVDNLACFVCGRSDLPPHTNGNCGDCGRGTGGSA